MAKWWPVLAALPLLQGPGMWTEVLLQGGRVTAEQGRWPPAGVF